jgi:hypothetical protein
MTVWVADVHAHVQRLDSVVEMATMLEEYTTEDQNSVVRFLWAKGLNTKDIHKEIFTVYHGKCLLHKDVHKCIKKFSQGRSKVIDDARPGHLVEPVTEATVQQAEELILANRRITIDSVAAALGCSHGLACSIMHDHLKFWRVCVCWVPRELKDQEKMN